MKLLMSITYDISDLQLKWQLVSMEDSMKRSAPVVYKQINSDREACEFRERVKRTVSAFENKYSCKCELINFTFK